MGIFLALIHHPVLNRHGEVSSTAVTNVDVHDVARAGRTYGVEKFFVVTPIALQQELIDRVIRHWTHGSGGKRSATRRQAFDIVEVIASVDAAKQRIRDLTGREPRLAVTGASLREEVTGWPEARLMAAADDPILLMFGTGWGLAPQLISEADIRLPAIDSPNGPGGFNHLSVRAAAVIV